MNRKVLYLKCFALIAAFCMVIVNLSGCTHASNDERKSKLPAIPQKLSMNDDDVPVLRVYNTESEQVEKTDIETYIMGVVAGEMKNTWPLEALKAQAILARTFTMKFVSSKDSGYPGADISTDIHEAQAYNADAVNDRIREAVNETRGIVMIAGNEFPYAWFHAHSGSRTELPTKALEFSHNPEYLSSVKSKESADAPEEVKNWTAEFTEQEIIAACKESGIQIESLDSFEIGERGESGRAVYFIVNGKKVSAPSFRLHIGASKLKSTLINSIDHTKAGIRFSGSGFGHGVGMSQWGAYQMAEEGKSAEDIVHYYFTGIELAELW